MAPASRARRYRIAGRVHSKRYFSAISILTLVLPSSSRCKCKRARGSSPNLPIKVAKACRAPTSSPFARLRRCRIYPTPCCTQRDPCGLLSRCEPAREFVDRERTADCAIRVVILLEGRAEHRVDRVSPNLHHGPFVRENGLRNTLEIGIQQL